MVRINLDRIEPESERKQRAILKQRQPMPSNGPDPDIYEVKFGAFSFHIKKNHEFPFDSVFGFCSEEDIRLSLYYPEINSSYTVYDVGATCGSYTLQPLVLGASVIAFEPDPRWAVCLQDNVNLNNLQARFGLGACALWSKNSTMSWEELEDVPCMTLDDFIEQNKIAKLPDFLKIDTEGAEIEIIKGAFKTIMKSKPKILVEHHAFRVPEGEREITKILEGVGYKRRAGPERDMTSWSFYHQ